MSGERDALPSASLRVRVADDVIVRERGWVAGGSPFHVIRLSEGATRHLHRWTAGSGAEISDDLAARVLARRLLDYGILLSEGCDLSAPGTPLVQADVDIVVPVRDRADQLDRCLAAVAARGVSVTVVDDGSTNPKVIAEVASRHGGRVIRLDVNSGPAAARNAGLRATSRPLVAFIDSDVMVAAGALERMVTHFADPLVAIATPRVLPIYPDQRGWLAGYENRYSALDMGSVGGNAGPGRQIPFVISAAMVARRSAIGSGFVEALRSGEDVDLGWRLSAAGWRVMYDPSTIVRHEHRVRLRPWLRKRWTYGHSVGPLARRHPGALAPLRVSLPTLVLLVAGLSGRPAIATGLFVARTTQVSRHAHGDSRLTMELIRRDIWFSSLGVARAVRRAWLPAVALAALWDRSARRALVLSMILRLCEGDRLPPRYIPLALLDDLIAASALGAACADAKTLDPLLPRLSK